MLAPMPPRLCPALLVLAALLGAPAIAAAHPERPTVFPVANGVPPQQEIPVYRSRGPSVVICKADSSARLKQEFKGDKRVLASRLKTLERCKFRDIQAGINQAKSGYRVLIMPGVYEEIPSRKVAYGNYHEGPCANDYALTEGFRQDQPPPVGPRSNDPPVRPNRNFQINCPNSRNLISVIGDPRPEPDDQNPLKPQCTQLCNLQIAGLGKDPEDVLIRGDRKKQDVLRIDRAWGIYLRNFTVEQAAFNDVDVVEVSGFRISKVVARYAQDYGILSFTAVNGVYDHVTAYGNGDSGIYPGSSEKGCDIDPNVYGTCNQLTPGNVQGGCQRYSIEIRESESYGNTLGYSGTAGNSTYVHDNKFHDNATGLSTDSFAQGHPGMPQECVKWENNDISSNNFNLFSQDNQVYCGKTPFPLRKRTDVCPQFQTAVGTGILIGGGNRNLIRDNHIHDNWRWGVLLIGVPAAIRNDNDPAHQSDTSSGNRFLTNTMGTAPDGARSPNGLDFKWDGQGAGNCWEGNTSSAAPAGGGGGILPGDTPGGGGLPVPIPPLPGLPRAQRQSDPAALPACPGSRIVLPANPAVLGPLVPCTAWDPTNNPDPVGCDWFTTPPKPK